MILTGSASKVEHKLEKINRCKIWKYYVKRNF